MNDQLNDAQIGNANLNSTQINSTQPDSTQLDNAQLGKTQSDPQNKPSSAEKPKKKKKMIFQNIFAGPKSVQMIQVLDKIFFKLPHLPEKLRKFLSKIMPWLILLGGLVSALAVLLSFFLMVLSLFALDFGLILTTVGSLLMILLNAMFLIKAFKPLRKYDAVGWIYLFWANVLGIINSVISVTSGNISGWQQISLTFLMTAIGFYLLFEIGSFYTYRKK